MKPFSVNLIGITLLLLFGLNACSLQVEQLFNTPDELALRTGSDVEVAVNGAYSKMQSADALGGFFVLYPDLFSDYVLVTNRNIAGDLRVYQRNVAGVGQNTYRVCYQAINIANNVLEAIDNNRVENSDFYAQNKDRLKGEALFVRAVMHFELLRLFGFPYHSPQATQSQSGIVLKLTPDRGKGGAPRATTREVYAQIEQDLRQAILLLPESFNSAIHPRSYRGRATKYAAMGYLVRVLWNKAENTNAAWQEIVDLCTTILTQYPVLDEFGETREQAPLNKTGYEKAQETIFQIVNMELSSTTGPILARYRYVNERMPHYTQSLKFRNDAPSPQQQIAQDNVLRPFEDKRVINYFEPFAVSGLGSFTAIQKYFNDFTNIALIRAAELYLIRAEAYFWLKNPALATADLDKVRQRAIKPTGHTVPIASTNLTARTEKEQITLIRREYFREMCYEGIFVHEYVRQNQLDDQAGTDYSLLPQFTNAGERNDVRERFITNVNWKDVTKYCYMLQIPDAEIFANPQIQRTTNGCTQ